MTSWRDERRGRGEGELEKGALFPYERILLTFADLPQVEELFQLALHLAAGPGRELFLLRVVPGGGRRVDAQTLYSELRAINVLLQAEAIPARLEAAPAADAQAIVAYAEEREVDLIIAVGRAGNGETYRRLVEDVLERAACTAMVLSPVGSEVEGAAGPVARRGRRPQPGRRFSERTN